MKEIGVRKQFLLKLDGVGPIDNIPSTDWHHHFVKFYLEKKSKKNDM